MDLPSTLSGAHLRTYNTIFQHPISHNLEWRTVRSLLEHIGNVVEENNGNLRATRNGETLVLHPARTKDVSETDEILGIRRFIEKSEAAAPSTSTPTEAHWLLVIDHHEARIYRSQMNGAVSQQILPHEPDAFFRHAHNSKEFSRGQEKPDPETYFSPVAAALKDAAQIVVFGSGKGTSSEMEQFISWARHRHPELSKRILGSLVVDEHHLTQGQLLAKAREFYASAAMQGKADA
jgi:hypothetical protein